METATAYFNSELHDALRNSVANYDEKVGRKVVNAVHGTLVDALGVEDEEVLSESLLVSDLRAESIDGLDINFRLNLGLGIHREGNPLELLTVLALAKDTYDKVTSQKGVD